MAFAVTLLVAIFIGIGALMPMSGAPGPDGGDKVLHFLAFAILVMPITLSGPRQLIWAAPAALVYGGAIEIIQPFVGRSREMGDLLADGLGIVVGAVVGIVIYALLKWSANRA